MADGGTINKVSVGPYEYNIGGEQPHLYLHLYEIYESDNGGRVAIFTTSSTPMSIQDFINYIRNTTSSDSLSYAYPLCFMYTDVSDEIALNGVYAKQNNNTAVFIKTTNSDNSIKYEHSIDLVDGDFDETIIQIF